MMENVIYGELMRRGCQVDVGVVPIVSVNGDFFARNVVTEGLQPPMKDETGIVHVGVIPFLLDESILDMALGTSRS